MKVEGQAEETANLENNAFGGFGGEEFTWDLNDNDSENVLEKAKKTDLTEEEIKGEEKKTPKEKKKNIEEDVFNEFSSDDDEPIIEQGDDEQDDDDEDEKPVKAKKEVEKTDNEDVDDETTEEDDIKFFSTLAKDLKEKGVFTSVDFKDDEKITEERFFELQDEEVEARVDESFNGLIQEIKEDPTGVAFLKHLKEGGNAKEFFKTYANSPTIEFPEDFDLDKEKNQIAVVKHYLMTEEEESEEEADETIELLTEKDKLAARAAIMHAKLVKKDRKAKEALHKELEQANKIAVERANSFKANLEKTLKEVDVVNNFKFTPEDKKKLVSRITSQSVKVGENRYVSEFQAKMAEITKNPEQLLQLAKFVLSDMDTSELVSNINTKVVKNVKSKLVDIAKTKIKKLGTGGTDKNRSLSDAF